ncbi:organic hydroperoxide reductase OsmC/OhrA [Roseibium hamelinense]|uniref:Organic hydroperoxide reductase OsmC/OhrA n=1 Tax=Roseibium hamelinense TaxID=150831 RepID=A0A562T3M7_9HYPH|nr:OsmC family protein [Roseibium hamelinense]MTI42928.1 OsmC family peroxiredoxin [Roseibium hamelinense]TWI87636.1 organic hydroperoxide reductase OsmC/OhrA [Roseibium hamelinense]
MASHVYTADVRWTRDGDFAANAYSRGHTWRFDGGVEVPASASPTVVPLPHSVEAAVDPEEAFVAAISSCHMLWVLDLARQNGMVVEAYKDSASGVMARIAPRKMAITEVTLRPKMTVCALAAPDLAFVEDLHKMAHELCFIANSVISEIKVEPQPVRLVAPKPGAA